MLSYCIWKSFQNLRSTHGSMKSGCHTFNGRTITCCPANIALCLPLMPPTHDELNWINANIRRRHRRCCPCSTVWTNEFRFWCGRNSKVILELSDKLGKSVNDAAVFLYDLTLQNYSQIVNPKKSGWNQCNRVPFTQPYLCDNFFSLFDDRGNVRNPTNPRSLNRLLQIFQKITRKEPADGIRTSSNSRIRGIKTKTSKGLIREEQSNILGAYDEAPLTGVPSFDKFKTKFVPSQHGDDYDFRQMPFYGKTASAENKFQDSMISLMDEKGRRRGKGSNPYQLGLLRGKSAQFLRFLIARVNEEQNLSDEPNEVVKAISELHLHKRRVGKRRHKREANAIADLYNAVVTKDVGKDRFRLRLKHPVSNQELVLFPDESKQNVKERRYFGEQIPVLYHEPYDENKVSTWMRRHPTQLRLLADGQVATGGIRRYRRESVQLAWERAGRRYSVHSLPSPENNVSKVSVKEQPMFGRMSLTKGPEMQRIFPPTERDGKRRESKAIQRPPPPPPPSRK